MRTPPADDDEFSEYLDEDDRLDPSPPPTVEASYQMPWWIDRGEAIEAAALSVRKAQREEVRDLGGSAGYDTFWGYVDREPVSVVLTVRAAIDALGRRDLALTRVAAPPPPALLAGVFLLAAMAFGIAGGAVTHRLVAAATTCLILGVALVWAGLDLPVPPRVAAFVAVACVVASAFPGIHMTRWYDVLVGFAFAAAGVVIAELWPIAREWYIERDHWKWPDVAMVAALVEFAYIVELAQLPLSRRRAVAALDRAATRFELEWHRVNRTGIDVTDRQLRAWAGRIRAETRELQRAFAFGTPSAEVLLLRTYRLIQAIVNRDPLADREDTWVRHGSWRKPPTSTLARLWVRSKASGRYMRQCLLAAVIAAAASFLLADTLWSAVHTYIGAHLSHQLGSALNFDPTVRLFVAGAGISMFAVAERAFSRRRL